MLVLSLCANLLFIAMGACLIHRRGGVEYVRARLRGLTDPVGGQWRYRQSLFDVFESYRSSGQHPVVFAGDSLTAGCDWHEVFGDAPSTVNRGISGDTTSGVLRRIEGISAMSPRAVFLMIGVNDCLFLKSKAGEIAANYEAIVKAMRTGSPGTAIYLQSILPVASFVGKRVNERIRHINRRIRALADGRTVVFVNLYEAFLEGTSLSARFTDDGVHLNAAGYALWCRKIAPFVRSQAGDETTIERPETAPILAAPANSPGEDQHCS